VHSPSRIPRHDWLSAAPSFQARMTAGRPGATLRILALVVAAVMLSGCSGVAYVARAAYEEGRILWNREPINQVLARPGLDASTREKLETVLQVREFARDRLGLSVDGAYATVSPVDRGAVVYVVMAARRDSLKPYLWWFPIVGYVPYRGYFSESRARAEAESMEAKGYDTLVRPAVAFSSLGFFADPLLSNLLKLDRVVLAGVIIHELFHRTYFLESDVMFDESAANFVGTRGAVDFFTQTEGASSADAKAARAVYESNLVFARFLLQAEAKLLRLYGSGLPKNEILKRRKRVFTEIQADYAKIKPMLSGLERFDLDKHPLNNAVMLNYMLYFHDQGNFAALERLNHDDTRATIRQIIDLAKRNPSDPFYAIWEASRPALLSPAPLRASASR
jgi:predicted aminopeptidase